MNPDSDFSTDIYDYKYKHHEIGELFESLKYAKTELDESLVWTKLGMLQARINRIFKNKSFLEFEDIYKRIAHIKVEYSNKNCNFLRNALK